MGRRVRSRTHLNLVLRPEDADATVLAARPAPVLEDTLRRTIFYRPKAPADRPGTATTTEAWQEAVTAMQPYVDQARRTWPETRLRFVKGLPWSYELLVTARISDGLGRQEQVFVSVSRVDGRTIFGRIQSDIRAISGWRRGDPYELDERELIDWTIVAPDGTEEGNVVGKFLDGWRLLRPRR
jgi:hypothetical protein